MHFGYLWDARGRSGQEASRPHSRYSGQHTALPSALYRKKINVTSTKIGNKTTAE